jgi:hypothetical protein
MKIPYKFCGSKLRQTLKSLLGQQTTIISARVSDIITPDDSQIVDVEYDEIPFSMMTIYYIPNDSLKSIIPNSSTYAASINDIPVKITLRKNTFEKYIPIRVEKIINYQNREQQFVYFGTPVKNPLSSYCSIMKYPNFLFQIFEEDPISPLFPKGFKPKKQISQNDSINFYKTKIKQIPCLSFIIDIIPSDSLKKCLEYTKGYMIDWRDIREEKIGKLKGIIMCQPDRLPYDVVYIPSQTFEIIKDELDSIDGFLKMEEINYFNYHFMMEKKS